MSVPKKWQDLPYELRRELLERVDLAYCPYESSREVAIASLLANSNQPETENYKRVQAYYSALTPGALMKINEQVMEHLDNQLDSLDDLQEELEELEDQT